MSRIIPKYDVDLRCPCCAVHPVMKVHDTTTVAVLFCSSCEHAWVMDSGNVPRHEQPIRSGRAPRASANRAKGALESSGVLVRSASMPQHWDATPVDAVAIGELVVQGSAGSPAPGLHSSQYSGARATGAHHPPQEDSMSAPRWRWSLIGVWIALTCITFIAIGSMAARSWLLLVVFGAIPPAMLLWLWNEDRPLLIGSLRPRQKQL